MHHVAAERRQLDPVDELEPLGPRLRELAGDAPHLHHRQRRAVRENGRHLQQDLQLLADSDRRELVERLDTVARLEQERTAFVDAGQALAELSRLAGEDERRAGLQARERGVGGAGVGPFGLLQRGVVAPGGRRPGFGGRRHGRVSVVAGFDYPEKRPCASSPASSPPAQSTSGTTPGAFASTPRCRSRATRSSASSTCTRSPSTTTRRTCASGSSTWPRCCLRRGSTRIGRPCSRRAT